MSQNRKLSYKWLGPYRIQKAILKKGTYILKEFDGTKLASTYSRNRLKKFVERHGFYILVTTDREGSEDNEGSEGSEGSEDRELEEAGIEEDSPRRRSSRLQYKPRKDWRAVIKG